MTPFELLGWLGNACFFGRFLVQWLHVERLRERAAPRTFWLLSLAGSLLLGSYAAHRGVWVLLVGFAVNGLIYLRNLHLGAGAAGARPLSRRQAVPLAIVSGLALVAAGAADVRLDANESLPWIAAAIVGQSIWTSRFVVQWWFSERSGASHFPPAFWILSLAGNGLLLGYALHLADAVFVAGLALGPFVQVRNLVLTGARQPASPAPPAPARVESDGRGSSDPNVPRAAARR